MLQKYFFWIVNGKKRIIWKTSHLIKKKNLNILFCKSNLKNYFDVITFRKILWTNDRLKDKNCQKEKKVKMKWKYFVTGNIISLEKYWIHISTQEKLSRLCKKLFSSLLALFFINQPSVTFFFGLCWCIYKINLKPKTIIIVKI